MKHNLRLEFEKMAMECGQIEREFGKIKIQFKQKEEELLKKENDIIIRALKETKGDITKAANNLEHGIKALYVKVYDRKLKGEGI